MAKRSEKRPEAPSARSDEQDPAVQKVVARAVPQVIQAVRAEFFSGPLPRPEHFQKYEEVCPGAANRILVMAERQSTHRQDLEKRVVRGDNCRSILGVVSGFLLGGLAIGGAIFLIYVGKNVPGSILGITGLASLVGVFVYGTQSRRREREAKEPRPGQLQPPTKTQSRTAR